MPQVCLKLASAANLTHGFARLIHPKPETRIIGHRNRTLFRKYDVLTKLRFQAPATGSNHSAEVMDEKLKSNSREKPDGDCTGITADQHWIACAQAKIPRPKIAAALRPRHAFRAQLPQAAIARFD